MRFYYTILICLVVLKTNAQLGPMGPNDTIPVKLVYKLGTDSFAYYYMPEIAVVKAPLTPSAKLAIQERTRMHRYIEDSYEMAMQAADIVNEMRRAKIELNSRKEKRKLVKAKERELKAQFTDKLKNMYVGQGKVLIKLLYRETGLTAYDIIKEMKSGLNARFWNTMSLFYSGSLKTKYEPNGADWEMELYVKEVARRYGRM